jgi:hypothetical protein
VSELWATKSPDEILRDIDALMKTIPREPQPLTMYISARKAKRIRYWMARNSMTKRQYRRWRGRMKEIEAW